MLFILGYLLVVGPPRASNLHVMEREQAGELKNQPLLVVLIVEYLMRSVMLLLIFFGVESLVGKFIYETYLLDYLGLLLLGLGALHTFSYYLCFALLKQNTKGVRLRLYRLLRNLTYSWLPGVGLVGLLLLVEFLQEKEPFTHLEMFMNVYLFSTAIVLLISMIEWALVKRHPLGLDVD
jgi:hypothetical protein